MISTRVALVWSFAERYLTTAIHLAASMVIARILSPADIGKFSLCAATLAIASTLRDFGVSEYIIQEKNLTKEKLRSVFAVAITVAWSIGLVVLLGRDWLAVAYKEPELATLLLILSINFFVLPLATPAYAMMNRDLQMRQGFVIQVTATVVQAGAGVGLALAGFGAASLAWASVLSIALQALMVTFFRPRDSLVLPSFKGARAVFRYGSLSVSARLIDTLTNNAHEFIIAQRFGFEALGLFSKSKGLADTFFHAVTTAIHRVVTPVMARQNREEQSLLYAFSRGTTLYTVIAWPVSLFMAIHAAELIRVMFGPQWDRASVPASILALSIIPAALFALSNSALSATGRVVQRLKVSLVYCPVHLLALAVTAMISFEAVAVTWTVSSIAMLIVHTRHMKALMSATARQLYAPSWSSAGVALSTGCVVGAMALLSRELELPVLVRLLLGMASAASAWLGAVFLLRHPARDEIIGILARLRQAPRGPLS